MNDNPTFFEWLRGARNGSIAARVSDQIWYHATFLPDWDTLLETDNPLHLGTQRAALDRLTYVYGGRQARGWNPSPYGYLWALRFTGPLPRRVGRDAGPDDTGNETLLYRNLCEDRGSISLRAQGLDLEPLACHEVFFTGEAPPTPHIAGLLWSQPSEDQVQTTC